MSYITAQEYAAITGQTAPADFSTLADVADSVIDAITTYGLVGREIPALPVYIQTKIKQAEAAQIQYMDARGGVTAINDAEYSSVSLGKFSYSTGGSAVPSNLISPMLGIYLPLVIGYLRGESG